MVKKSKINYSIIIPNKNNIKLLKRCLDSIPRREDIQIIVIDDNSNPSILEFNNYPGLNNPNADVIFTNDGKGAGYARNVGLKHAKGEWIFFADSDDYYNNCFLNAIDKYLLSNADIIYFSSNSVFSNTLKVVERGIDRNQLIDCFINKENNSNDNLRYFYTVPWAKMFNHSFIKKHKLQFDEIIAGNDIMFSIKSGYYAKTIYADKSYIYSYTMTKGSLTNRNECNVIFNRYLATLRVNKFLKNNKKNKYRRSIIYYIIKLSTFGINSFVEAILLAIKYKSNPFVGFGNWAGTIIFKIKKKKEHSYYITK